MHDLEALKAAHQHSSNNRAEIAASSVCGCFNCLRTFPPSEVADWWDDYAVCKCGIDSVLGDASGLPVTDPVFLKAMYHYAFDPA